MALLKQCPAQVELFLAQSVSSKLMQSMITSRIIKHLKEQGLLKKNIKPYHFEGSNGVLEHLFLN